MIETLLPTRPLRGAAGVQRSRTLLQALCIDSVFMGALRAGPLDGHVHSVFHRVVNLERSSGELLTLAARSLDNAPDTAIVDVADFANAGINVGDAFESGEGGLRIVGAIAISWAAAPTWQASLPRYGDAKARLPDQLRAARSYLARHRLRADGFERQGVQAAFEREIDAALQQRSAWLIEALAETRHADACRHAVSLIGLGPGLTPSGDDFLVGLFAVLNIADSPCCGWLAGGAEVLAHAADSTHAISLVALTAAAKGRVRESISALIEALLHGTPDTLTEPLRRVLAIGATSGADITAGILAGLALNLHVQALLQ